MCDPLGMADRVHDCDRRRLRDTEQSEAIQADRVDHRLQIGDPRLDRQITDLAVRQPAATFVVADEQMIVGELAHPVPPHRTLEVEVEVRQPRRHANDRRSPAAESVRKPHAIGRGAEANLLLHSRKGYFGTARGPAGSCYHGSENAGLMADGCPPRSMRPCSRSFSGVRLVCPSVPFGVV